MLSQTCLPSLHSRPGRTDPCIAPFFALVENAGIFYFSHNYFFANFDFIFAIRDPKLGRVWDEI